MSNINDSPLVPASGRLCGVDFGTVRVGLAVCDAGQTISSPLEIYHRKSQERDAEYFQRLVKDEQIVGFVVGLPVHMSGDESQASYQARKFGSWLGELTGLPVTFFDERLSTSLANQILAESSISKKRNKAKLDKVAAQIILAAFLESNRGQQAPGPLDDHNRRK